MCTEYNENLTRKTQSIKIQGEIQNSDTKTDKLFHKFRLKHRPDTIITRQFSGGESYLLLFVTV